MKLVLPIILAAMMFFVSSSADARKYRFGTVEDVHFIQDVDLTGSQNEKLYLGYKISTMFVLIPAYITDDGYVLGVSGGETYYQLSDAQITEFQGQGLLPNPLPPYKLEILDYIFGYLLWVVLALVAALYAARALWRRSRAG